MLYELVTGDYLFDPKGCEAPDGSKVPREEDHLAQMLELCGPMPPELLITGKRAAMYFDQDGTLRHIKELGRYTVLESLVFRHRKNPVTMAPFAEFLQPMLHLHPGKRATAEELLHHPWLQTAIPHDAWDPETTEAKAVLAKWMAQHMVDDEGKPLPDLDLPQQAAMLGLSPEEFEELISTGDTAQPSAPSGSSRGGDIASSKPVSECDDATDAPTDAPTEGED